MGKYRKRLILVLFALFFAANAYALSPVLLHCAVEDGCDQASDTTIIGRDNTSGVAGAQKAAGFLYLVRRQAEHNCRINELHIYVDTDWGSGEDAIVCLYNDAGDTLLAYSGEVEGDGVLDIETFTLNTTVQLTEDTYYIMVFHNELAATTFYIASDVGNKTKAYERDGGYSSTCPASVEVTDPVMSDQNTSVFYGTNP